MPDNTDLDKSVQELKNFTQSLETLLREIKGIGTDRETRKHQKNLEKILKASKNILDDGASAEEIETFRKLQASAELSTELLRQSFEDNKKINNKLLLLSQSIVDVSKSVNVISSTTAQDIKQTTSAFLTGPFGAILGEAVSGANITEAIGGFRERKASKKQEKEDALKAALNQSDGQFHEGIASVPKTGSFVLEKGERIITRDVGEDLRSFLDSVGKSDTGVPSGGIGGGAEAIVKTMIDLDAEGGVVATKRHKDFQINSDRAAAISLGIGKSFGDNQLVYVDLFMTRFFKHPILNTMRFALLSMVKLIELPFKIIGAIFGRKKETDSERTDRVVKSNQDILRSLQGREVESDAGFFKRAGGFFRDVFGEKGTKKAGELEARRIAGEKLTTKELEILNKNLSLITTGNVQAMQREEEQAENIKDMTTFMATMSENIGDIKEKGGGLGGSLGGLLSGIGVAGIGANFAAKFASGLASAKAVGLIAAKFLGGIGLALAGGVLIGKFIVNPLIEALDKNFGLSIQETIGKAMVNLVAFLEGLPLIGTLIKGITGGQASAAIAGSGESNRRARRSEADTRAFQGSAKAVELAKSPEAIQNASTKIQAAMNKTNSPEAAMAIMNSVKNKDILAKLTLPDFSNGAQEVPTLQSPTLTQRLNQGGEGVKEAVETLIVATEKQTRELMNKQFVNNTQQATKESVTDLGTQQAVLGN